MSQFHKPYKELLFYAYFSQYVKISFYLPIAQYSVVFTDQTVYSAGSGPYSVVAVDVNGDNKPDIIVANFGSNNVGVLLNAGNGTFIAQTTYSTDSGPYSVAVADVNGDNKIDIIVANHGSNNVSVLLNTGNGTFIAQTTYSTGSGSSPSAVAIADVNGDNKLDIIVANEGSNNIGVFLSLGEPSNFTE